RGDESRYRAARDRISSIGERGERNGLFDQWLRAVDAINPLRVERLEAMQAGAVALGFDDRVEMVRSTRGWNPDELAAVTRGALNDSETGYYAAMRRLLARAGIEQVRIPGDVRLVLNPRGGWEDMGAALHATGRLEHSVHVPAGTPASLGLLGDPSVSQGYAFLMGGLLGDPEWLEESVGMGDSAQVAFVDFLALAMLYRLRLGGGQLIYELGLHRGGEHAIHRALYAGTLGLL